LPEPFPVVPFKIKSTFDLKHKSTPASRNSFEANDMKIKFAVLFSSILVTARAQVDCSKYQADEILSSLLRLSYVVNINDSTTGQGTFSAELVYTGQGWISLGFSSNGVMVPSQAVIALPDVFTVQKYDLTLKDISGVLPSPSQTLQDVHVEQNFTHTTMRFTKLLMEDNEIPIIGNGSNTFIWAFGSSNLLDYHKGRGAYSLTLAPCIAEVVSPDTSAPAMSAPVVPTPDTSLPTTSVIMTSAPITSAPTTSAPTTSAPIGSVPVASAPSTSIDCSKFQQELTLADGVTFRYTVNLDTTDSTTGVMSAQIVYKGLAWLSLGFAENIAGAMVPSNAVIGLPNNGNSFSNPGKYLLSSKSIQGVTLLSDDRQTLKNHSIIQNDTHTVLTFDKILVESNEVPIVLGTKMAFIWAYGFHNDLNVHAKRGAFLLTINACVPGAAASTESNGASKISTPGTYRSLWSAHGTLAGIAWGIMSPIAISSSLLRDLIPRAGLWFKIHIFLNMSVFVFTVIAFILAVTALEKGRLPGSSADHFSKISHRTVGLVIMVCVALQVLGGMIRPHAPGKKENGEPEDKHTIRVIWELAHKASGYVLLATAWWQVQDGLKLYAGRFGSKDLSSAFLGFVAGIVVLCASLIFYSKCIVQRTINNERDRTIDGETKYRV
jgi:DOMON domain